MLPIALQLYSIRDDVAADMHAALVKVKEMGYDGVELAGALRAEPEQIKAWCDELGLIPISAHVPYVSLLNDTEETIKQYAKIGVKYVAIPGYSEEYRPGREKFGELIESMYKIGDICKKYGIQLIYHNHDFEFAKIDGEYALDYIYRTVPADVIEPQLDTCWVNVGGEDPAAYVRKYSGRINIVHLKDFAGQKSKKMYALIGIDEKETAEEANTFEFRPVGFGKQNMPDIMKASIEAGAKWVVVEQDNPSLGKTPLECAKLSIDYLKLLSQIV